MAEQPDFHTIEERYGLTLKYRQYVVACYKDQPFVTPEGLNRELFDLMMKHVYEKGKRDRDREIKRFLARD